MKIFEYSFETGKGTHIGDAKYSGLSEQIGKHRDYPVHAGLSTIKWVDDKPTWQDNLTADDFGAPEAILFCTGSWKCGEDVERWEWAVVPNKALVEKGVARNQAKYGHSHKVS